MNRSLCVLVSVAAISLAAAVPSLAATPIVVGQGEGGTPDISVDSAGRAHIVWNDTSPPPTAADVVYYCRLARGASSCGAGSIFGASPFGIFGRPHVFSYAPDQVSVFYQRCCGVGSGTREVYSNTAGASFLAEDRLSDTETYSASEAAMDPSVSAFGVLSELNTAATVQWADITGVETAEAILGSAGTNQGAIAIQASGRPVVVYQNQTSPWSFVWRKLSDSFTPSETTINNAANWTPEAPLDNDRVTAASGPALAGGPGGVFVFYQKRAPDEGFIRSFNGTGWTAPIKIVEGQSFNDLDLFQDDGGRLHAVWSAYNDGALRYRWSDNGVNWSPTVDIARGENGYSEVRVSAASDHQGFAVWNRGGPDVVAVPLEALPPLPPPGGGPGGGGPPRVDVLPPVVGGFDIGRDTLLPGEGSRFGFNSSEAGLATLTVRRQVAGLRVRRAGSLVCVPRTRGLVRRIRRSSPSPRAFRRALRSRRCPARKTVGRISQAVVAGQNTITFNGRLAGRTLRPGRYFAQLQIRDAAGNLSRVETLRFRVVRPRRR